MTSEQKNQIVLMHNQGCGYKKIAACLDIFPNTVKSWLNMIVDKCHEIITDVSVCLYINFRKRRAGVYLSIIRAMEFVQRACGRLYIKCKKWHIIPYISGKMEYCQAYCFKKAYYFFSKVIATR